MLTLFGFGSPYMPSRFGRGRGSDSSEDEEFIPTVYGPLPLKRKSKPSRKSKKSRKCKKDKKSKKKHSKKRASKAYKKKKSSSSSSYSSSSSSSKETRTRHRKTEKKEGRDDPASGHKYEGPKDSWSGPWQDRKPNQRHQTWGQPNRQWQGGQWYKSSGRGQGWNKWSAEELKMQEALLQSAVEEAWSDKTRVLSFSELPKEHRGTPYKECVDNVEADAIEGMEDRIKAHAKVPDAMLHYIARFLAALPQGVLPSELKWTQHTASHFAASILELSLTPTIQDPSAVQVPDPVHSHYITAARGTNWASAFSILRESMIRPQAAKGGDYPSFGFFARGSIESYNNHTAIKALEGCARKSKATGSGIVLLVSARAHSVQVLEGGLGRVHAACRRDWASRSASDNSLCIRSEGATIRALAESLDVSVRTALLSSE